MKIAALLAPALALTAGLALAGCSNPFGSSENGAAISNASLPAASAVDPTRREDRERAGRDGKPDDAAPPARGNGNAGAASGVTEAWFVGSWSDDPQCREPVEFLSNGNFVNADGSRGDWRLDDRGNLTLDGPGGTRRTHLTRVNDDQVRTETGGSSYRCD